jgi:steroid delta-isomerase-like uncharacterized protein
MKIEEQNKELVKRTIEAWEKGDFETLEELWAPNFVFYYPSASTKPLSRESTIELGKMLRNAFPDVSFEVHDLLAVEDWVVFRFIQRGTHKGEYLGIPATGNRIESSGIYMSRIENGKVVEAREEFDMVGLMEQLGMALKPKKKRT